MAKILLVEDEAIIAMGVSLELEDAGYFVETASDGQEGLECAIRDRPDAIVTDFMMPRMDGIEMAERLRDAGYTSPIILVSAIPQEQLPLSTVDFAQVILKPYTAGTLIPLLPPLQKPDAR